jgi:hypothetical protein
MNRWLATAVRMRVEMAGWNAHAQTADDESEDALAVRVHVTRDQRNKRHWPRCHLPCAADATAVNSLPLRGAAADGWHSEEIASRSWVRDHCLDDDVRDSPTHQRCDACAVQLTHSPGERGMVRPSTPQPTNQIAMRLRRGSQQRTDDQQPRREMQQYRSNGNNDLAVRHLTR